jgi:uncharacterized membrane protein
MPKKKKENFGLHLTTRRLEALTDGIFAIAMTLLVLSINLPDTVADVSNTQVYDLLFGQAHKLFNYFLSFMLLAIFWIRHHSQFHRIRKLDSGLIWINIFILMFVALMPFTTGFAGDYSGSTLAEILFASNLLILGLLFWANWFYATRDHRLVDPDLDDGEIIIGLRRSMVIPIVSLVVILSSFFIPRWSLWLYLSIPIALILPPFRRTWY